MNSLPAKSASIVAVDDDPGLLLSVKAIMMSNGLGEPALFSDSAQALRAISEGSFQVALLDLIMPGMNGLALLEEVKAARPELECIVLSAVDEAPSAVKALRLGAYDYLVKPVDSDKLVVTVKRALERHNLKKELSLWRGNPGFHELSRPEAFSEMVAEDPAMARVFHQAELAAPTDYNLFLTGESGTGKEMLARVVHRLSKRAQGPFVAVNLAAVTPTLFESEFFGHAAGAFTGAVGEKKGYLEAAVRGTLFLDEVTEMAPELQGKLLRVIQEKSFHRLGDSKPRRLDSRLLAASNRDLEKEVKNGRFRSDLFYRLNTFRLHLPPLRERKRDIIPLARHFAERHAAATGKAINGLGEELAARLTDWPFPGNVRELDNLVAGAVLRETGPVLSLASCPSLAGAGGAAPAEEPGLLSLEEVERRHILRVLAAVAGNRTQAARVLGIGLRTLQRKMKQYGVQ